MLLDGFSFPKLFHIPSRMRSSIVPAPNVLSCDEYRYFWMTWDRASLTIGSGEVIGEDIIMDYAGPRGAEVRAATFSSTADEDTEWDIPMYEGG